MYSSLKDASFIYIFIKTICFRKNIGKKLVFRKNPKMIFKTFEPNLKKKIGFNREKKIRIVKDAPYYDL